MRLLLEDRLAPITSEVGFLEIDSGKAAESFAAWQAGVLAPRGMSVRPEHVSAGSLEEALRRLLPLTTLLSTSEQRFRRGA